MKSKKINKIARKYNTRDNMMFCAAETIMDAANEHKAYLLSKRSIWKDPFFADLSKKIETILHKYMGIDKAQNQVKATAIVNSIMANALLNLGDVKVQIEEDFKNDPTRLSQILGTLGYKLFYADASRKQHAAVVDILFRFKQNLDAALLTELTSKGISPDALNLIVGYADELQNANVNQANYFLSKQNDTEEAVNAYNEVYESVISVCRIAARFFKDQPAIKKQFVFSQVVAAIKHSTNNPGKNPPPSPSTPS